MLNRVLDRVAAAGWFDVAKPFEKTINLTQGACLWLLLTRHGECDTYVKFSERVSLGTEAARYAAASRCYPTLVPRFVGYLRQDGLEVLVCRAIDYRGLHARQLQRPSAQGRILGDLTRYFAAMPAAKVPAELTPHANTDLVAGLGPYFAAHSLGPLAQRWLSGENAGLAAALPNMPQHGDLVLNNIGQTLKGAAVVFDWEDFGASCLPGLDLFTLELSVADGDASRLSAGREFPSAPFQCFVREACAAMQLDFHAYRQLTPIYALVFRHLKRNYGPEVRARMDRLLLQMDRQSPSPAS